MKKMIFLVSLVLVTVIMHGYKHSGPNEASERNGKTVPQKDLKSLNNARANETNTYKESQTSKFGSDEKPKILLMLTNETGMKKWSPSLWWSYKPVNPGKPGC